MKRGGSIMFHWKKEMPRAKRIGKAVKARKSARLGPRKNKAHRTWRNSLERRAGVVTNGAATEVSAVMVIVLLAFLQEGVERLLDIGHHLRRGHLLENDAQNAVGHGLAEGAGRIEGQARRRG